MKNYIIGVLIVAVLAVSSSYYKYYTHTQIPPKKTLEISFVVGDGSTDKKSKDKKLYLYAFFSKNNCSDCMKSLEVLNGLPTSMFVVKGLVPDHELSDLSSVLEKTHVEFPIEGQSKLPTLLPQYTPTVVGVTRKGTLLCVIPGVPGEQNYIEQFLYSLYYKSYNNL